MAPPISNRWTTRPKYMDLLNYIIQKTTDAKSPMNIRSLAKEFKETSGAAQTVSCFISRIERMRTHIHSFEHIDTNTKVKLIFALGASVDASFLKRLKKDAVVEFDNKIRITHYKANDGNLELKGDHSQSAKNRTTRLESKGSLRSLINSYFETKGNADAVPKSEEQKEMGNLIEFITEKCVNADSPLRITRLATDFKNRIGITTPLETIRARVRGYSSEIQKVEFLDTHSKVQQLFGLSATVNSDYLEILRKDAFVEIDDRNRIIHYTAHDGSLDLNGDHSLSAKQKTRRLESEESYPSMINGYFENKNNPDAIPKNEKEKEMWNFIEFITEKCENVNSPLSFRQLMKDFNNHFGLSRTGSCIHRRITAYCREIQKMDSLDTFTKVKQLFCLSAKLDSDYLEKLRKDAVVEVDHLNRITEYTANDGHLKLCGDHSFSEKRKLAWIEWRRNEKGLGKHCNSDGDKGEESEIENGYSEDDSDEYSSEELGSEFDSDDENDNLDTSQDLTEPSSKASDFNNETPIRNHSELSIDNSFDLDPPTKRSHRTEETEMREFDEEENDVKITESAVIKTRSGRLSKRRHLDSNFSYDLANSSSSGVVINSSSSYSKPAKHFPLTERSHVPEVIEREDGGRKKKKRDNYSTGSSLPKQIGSSSNNSMRPNKLDDYNKNYSIDYQVKLEPFRGSIQEDLNGMEGDEDIQLMLKPHQTLDEHNRIEEVPIKVEPEELKIVENPAEDVKPEIAQAHDEHKELIEVSIKLEQEESVEVKPETSHDSRINFFEAMHSLLVCLDTPCLSWIQSKIHQKIQKLEGSDEVILNNEISLTIELLISQMINHSIVSIVNLSETAKSVNFSNFLCYLKAAILNLKLSGVDDLVKNISKLIEESQNKRIPMEKVANALLVTLDIDCF